MEAAGGHPCFHPHRADDRFLSLGWNLDRNASFRLSHEFAMAGVRQRTLGKGSKKRVARVRWGRRDLLHLALWSLLVIGVVLWLDVWVSGHAF
jgi:hypothetical protein